MGGGGGGREEDWWRSLLPVPPFSLDVTPSDGVVAGLVSSPPPPASVVSLTEGSVVGDADGGRLRDGEDRDETLWSSQKPRDWSGENGSPRAAYEKVSGKQRSCTPPRGFLSLSGGGGWVLASKLWSV